jgi:hypothetical protein
LQIVKLLTITETASQTEISAVHSRLFCLEGAAGSRQSAIEGVRLMVVDSHNPSPESSGNLETWGYGFGFTAFMLCMIYIARGKHQTAPYAICTGFMALGMMPPGLWNGWLQESPGSRHFFVWILLATAPNFIVA